MGQRQLGAQAFLLLGEWGLAVGSGEEAEPTPVCPLMMQASAQAVYRHLLEASVRV